MISEPVRKQVATLMGDLVSYVSSEVLAMEGESPFSQLAMMLDKIQFEGDPGVVSDELCAARAFCNDLRESFDGFCRKLGDAESVMEHLSKEKE